MVLGTKSIFHDPTGYTGSQNVVELGFFRRGVAADRTIYRNLSLEGLEAAVALGCWKNDEEEAGDGDEEAR